MDLLNKDAVLDLKNDNILSAVEYELITVTDQPAQPPPAAKPTSEAQPTVA